MFFQLALLIAGFVVFIVGFGLVYRQGKKQGYGDGYCVGKCDGFKRGFVQGCNDRTSYCDYYDGQKTPGGIEISDTTTSAY